MNIENEIEELKHRVEALEQLVRSILSKVPEVRIERSVPKIIYERRYEYVKISEDELYGRIFRLVLDGFFDEWRSASDVARELLRRGWAPKDFKHVRPALEHLVALEVLERERKPGRKAKWLYRKAGKLGEKVMIIEAAKNQSNQ
jgi:uncharacterized protein (DUF2384 family)